MIHQSIQPFLPNILVLLQKHQIKSAYLFGSVLTKNFNDQSDVDFLVTIRPDLDPVEAGGHLWDLTYQLEELLTRSVDLLTYKSLKNPYFIEQLEQSKYHIYGDKD